jgi:hypothetical protein
MHACLGNDILKERQEVQSLREQCDHHLTAVRSSRQLHDEATLAAIVMLVFTDLTLGQRDWIDHLAVGKDTVACRGGVEALLSSVPRPLRHRGLPLWFCPGHGFV